MSRCSRPPALATLIYRLLRWGQHYVDEVGGKGANWLAPCSPLAKEPRDAKQHASQQEHAGRLRY